MCLYLTNLPFFRHQPVMNVLVISAMQ